MATAWSLVCAPEADQCEHLSGPAVPTTPDYLIPFSLPLEAAWSCRSQGRGSHLGTEKSL